MRQIRIDTGHMVNIIDVRDTPRPDPIIIKIELIEVQSHLILSRGFKVIEIQGDHLVII